MIRLTPRSNGTAPCFPYTALFGSQLWALGGQDIDAPAGETARRIKGLIAEGRPITLAVFPKAEHGMTEFETAPDGSRVSTRFTPGYFLLLIDYAKVAPLDPAYGDAEITRPATKSEEDTSEHRTLMRISYADFYFNKKNKHNACFEHAIIHTKIQQA